MLTRLIFALSLMGTSMSLVASVTHTPESNKVTFALSVSSVDSVGSLESFEIVVPDLLVINEVEVDANEEVDLSLRAIELTGSYFILPFLELSGFVGKLSSDSVVGGTIKLDIDPPFGVLNNNIEFDFATKNDLSGESYGIGMGLYIPLAKSQNAAIMRFNANYAEYRFDSAVNSQISMASLSIIKPMPIFDTEVLWLAGVRYIDLTRESSFTRNIGGESLGIATVRDLNEPVSINIGASVPVTEHWHLTYGLNYQSEDNKGHRLQLLYRF